MQVREIKVFQIDMTATELHAIAEALTMPESDLRPVHRAVISDYIEIAEQYLPDHILGPSSDVGLSKPLPKR